MSKWHLVRVAFMSHLSDNGIWHIAWAPLQPYFALMATKNILCNASTASQTPAWSCLSWTDQTSSCELGLSCDKNWFSCILFKHSGGCAVVNSDAFLISFVILLYCNCSSSRRTSSQLNPLLHKDEMNTFAGKRIGGMKPTGSNVDEVNWGPKSW